jgi:integrase
MQGNAFAVLPFAQAAPTWLEGRKKIGPRTRADYEQYIAALNSFFAELKLIDIHVGHIQEYQKLRQAGSIFRGRMAGASRINHETSTLSQILARAALWKAIEPYFEPLPVSCSTRGRALSVEEEATLWRVASSNPRWKLAYFCSLVTAMTGAGPGEIRHLRMRDMDLTRGYIYVTEGVKNRHRVREIPLNDQALEAMKWLAERALRRGSVSPDHYLLSKRANKMGAEPDPYTPMGSWKTAFNSLKVAAASSCPSLKKLRMYDLRHHCATKMLENPDISERTVIDIMGHVSGRMLSRYSHIRVEEKKRAVEALRFTPPAPNLSLIKK